MARVDIDAQDLYRDLVTERVFVGEDVMDSPSRILHSRLTEFRLIGDGSFMSMVDITVAQNYSLRLATKKHVLFVFYVKGRLILPWDQGGLPRGGRRASVTVLWDSGRATDYLREAGEAYKRLSIFIDAAKLTDHYGLNVDNLPPAWNGIFYGRENARAAIPLTLSSRSWLALDAIYRCKMEEPLRTTYLNAKSQELICETVFQLNQIGSAGKSSSLAKATKARQLIESAALIYQSELHNQPNIENLARRLGINRNKLSEGFREMFGMTPGDYAKRVRLDWARDQVREGMHSIGEIATAAGYSNISSFTHAYVEQFGCPPSHERTQSDGATSRS